MSLFKSKSMANVIHVYKQTLSPAQVAANTTAEQTLIVTGLKASDTVLSVVKPTADAGLGIVGARISADDTLAITFANVTAGALTPTASEDYLVMVMR